MKPSPAGLSVQPPRCRLDLALADPHGRGREQTRVGGAGAEAEGRAQREEAAEPRSQAGRCHSASPPPAAARGGVGEAQPSGEGGILQGWGGCTRRGIPARGYWSLPGPLLMHFGGAVSGALIVGRIRWGGKNVGRWPWGTQAGEGAAISRSTWGNCASSPRLFPA